MRREYKWFRPIPGTPSTEITEAAAKYDEMHVEWSTNEKVGVEVAAGACCCRSAQHCHA